MLSMSAAAIPATRLLLSAEQLERLLESDTPIAVIEAQLVQIAEHAQRLDTDSLCELLAVLDQQHRRGRLEPGDFRRLKSRIAPLIVSGSAPQHAARSAPARTPPQLRPVPPAPPPPAREVDAVAPAIGPGRVLRGRYELRRLLGEGGMSCVYEAVDLLRDGRASSNEATVAVKLLRPALASRPDAVQALHLEFERVQRLSHPSIVNVHGLDADGDVHFITMERLDGELLGHAIRRLRPGFARRDHAFAILARLGEAVAFAHEAGIVHADLKPGNVMLTRNGELRLFDFGAAWPAQREPWIYEAGEPSLQGATPAYASAERLGGAVPTVRDDIYSFCCVAYELLTGLHPFDRQPAREAERLRMRPRRPAGLTRRQWRALVRGLAFRREDRWPDMRALLEQLLPPGAARTPLPPWLDSERPPRRSNLSGLTLLLLGGAAFAVAYYAGRGLPAPLQGLLDQAMVLLAALFR